jgi:UDPglucose 6-dehydrogenase
MQTPVFVDGRNVYEPETMWQAGFLYRGIGRGYNALKAAELANEE